MKRLQATIFTVSLLCALSSACFADTFKHRKTSEVLHGYPTNQTQGSETIVHTQEKGIVKLNLTEYDITANQLGRNNKVTVLTIDNPIALQLETTALEQAVIEAADQGPLFILLEIDTPGGRTDLVQRICAAITKTKKNCPIIAFVTGGQHGGAISAGAAVAFACDKIYMANNTIIGAATGITFDETGRPQDLKKAFGETVGEKFSSIWQAYLASLAEQNKRPALLARAMVDKDIEVIEVSQAQKRLFIEPINKMPHQKLIHTWSKKGSLLALTAAEAVKCNIADKVINSQRDILNDLNAADARIVINDSTQKARRRFERVKLKFNRLMKSLDLQNKQLQQKLRRRKALSLLRSLKSEYKALIKLVKNYPDLHINPHLFEEQLNSVEALYQKAKMKK